MVGDTLLLNVDVFLAIWPPCLQRIRKIANLKTEAKEGGRRLVGERVTKEGRWGLVRERVTKEGRWRLVGERVPERCPCHIDYAESDFLKL